MLDSLYAEHNKKELHLPSVIFLYFVVINKNKGNIVSVYRKEFRYKVGIWGEGEVGRVTLGEHKNNKIVLDCDNVSANQGFIKVEISDIGVLNFYYQDSSRYGTVFNGRIIHKRGFYLKNHSTLYFGDLLNGRSCEVMFDYGFGGQRVFER